MKNTSVRNCGGIVPGLAVLFAFGCAAEQQSGVGVVQEAGSPAELASGDAAAPQAGSRGAAKSDRPAPEHDPVAHFLSTVRR